MPDTPAVFSPTAVLGIKPNANPEEIRAAFKKLSVKHHPDRAGDNSKMADIIKAYKILTDPEKLKEWEEEQRANGEEGAGIEREPLSFTGERPSAAYRQVFLATTKIFTQTPRAKASTQTRQEMWQQLNPLFQTELAQPYYQQLYRAANGTEYEDVYQLVQHNSQHTAAAPLDPNQLPTPLSATVVLTVLLDFLHGKYYGENLKAMQNYLKTQISTLYQLNNPLVTLSQAVLSLISQTSLQNDHAQILKAIDSIYQFVAQMHDAKNADVIRLMRDKHFRHFLSHTLKYFWQSDVAVVNQEFLRNLKSQYAQFKKILPLGPTVFRLEQQFAKVFSEESSLEDIHEIAYIMIDLSEAGITAGTRMNAILLAGLCFHTSAQRESEMPKAMATEFIASLLYRKAIASGFGTSVSAAVYGVTHAINYLTQLSFQHPEIAPDALKAELINPNHYAVAAVSGSVTDVLATGIKRAAYLLDLAPFYVAPCGTIDLDVMGIFQRGLLAASLQGLSAQEEPLVDHVLAKVLYHAYEDSVLYPFNLKTLG